uniref:Small ribosomal subunit protein bS16 n=1 Tax=candidate division CPR3 bacterium TaxID=2268181 RepID=A0A7C5URY1_UNCC3
MLAIRLQPQGKKKQRQFRIVVQNKKESRDGPIIENLGVYNPKTHPPVSNLKIERIEWWISKGAQLSETVRSLIQRAKENNWDELLKRHKVSKHKKAKKEDKKQPAEGKSEEANKKEQSS